MTRTRPARLTAKMFSCNCKENDIEKMIENGMENVGTASVGISAIPIGRQSDYPIGTISAIAHSSNTFYLLAISRNDEYGNSVSSKNDIESAMNNLLTYYNRFGQGYHLYLPLLGTGRSRAGLSHQESYELIIQTMKKHKNKINGEITIVVHPKDKNYVAIKKGDAFDGI